MPFASSRRMMVSPHGLARMLAGLVPVRTTQEVTIARRAMACEFSVTLPAGLPGAVDLGCAALDEIERLEAKLSAYREDSHLTRLNRNAATGAVAVDVELFDLLALARRITEATGGAFDVATGALTRAWGFYRGPKRVPTQAELAAARAASGSRHVQLDAAGRTVRYRRAGLEINLGSIGKGYAIDRALAVLRKAGLRAALVQGGRSSVRAAGAWKVAIGGTGTAVWLRDRALGASGGEHQFFVAGGVRYGHLLDPRTGWPAGRLASATALAPTAAEADALSTAFYVLGVEGAREYCRAHPGIGAVLAPRRGRVIVLGEVETG